MKTLYLDCGMGAAGDMMTAALLELFPDLDAQVDALNAIGIPKVTFRREHAMKCGIGGTRVIVDVDGEVEGDETHHHHHEHDHEHEHAHEHPHHHEHGHHHSSMHDIEHLVMDHLTLPEEVKQDVMAVYRLIAEAESQVHQKPVTEIHFHEVGTMDALADITAVCVLIRQLFPAQVVASSIHVGCGQVRCAHGILPVPAPATALLLQGIPIYGGAIQGELCTPTGAALLRHFVTHFGEMPPMRVEAIGYGMGTKDFPAANCLRALLGETVAEEADRVVRLSCNVDDMTAEEIGFAMERLLAEDALDVYTIPIGMKKSRPGTLISVICRPADKEKMVQAIFRFTSTIGLREETLHRHVLQRETAAVKTPLGEVRRKTAEGYGVTRVKFEYDDLARLAKEKNLSLDEVKKLLDGHNG